MTMTTKAAAPTLRDLIATALVGYAWSKEQVRDKEILLDNYADTLQGFAPALVVKAIRRIPNHRAMQAISSGKAASNYVPDLAEISQAVMNLPEYKDLILQEAQRQAREQEKNRHGERALADPGCLTCHGRGILVYQVLERDGTTSRTITDICDCVKRHKRYE